MSDVYRDLGVLNAAAMRAKADLALAIQQAIEDRGWTAPDAAKIKIGAASADWTTLTGASVNWRRPAGCGARSSASMIWQRRW